MRNASFVFSRQITSSRQSPKISALKLGVALVPLFEEMPEGASIGLDVLVFHPHLEIVGLSRISRNRSPSHQTMKFICPGRFGVICVPLAAIKPPRAPHIS